MVDGNEVGHSLKKIEQVLKSLNKSNNGEIISLEYHLSGHSYGHYSPGCIGSKL